MKHTPGPWELVLSDGGRVLGIRTTALYPVEWDEDDTQPRKIVETDSGFYPPRLPDARLIAAAPDLLEALEGLRKHYDSFYGPLWDKAEEAIRKARTDSV